MELHDRLQAARKEAGFETAADAARRFAWNINTYSSNENGNRAFSRTKAIVYAKAFKVDLEWLLTGAGEMRPKNNPETAQVIDIWDRLLPKQQEEFLSYGKYLESKNDEEAG